MTTTSSLPARVEALLAGLRYPVLRGTQLTSLRDQLVTLHETALAEARRRQEEAVPETTTYTYRVKLSYGDRVEEVTVQAYTYDLLEEDDGFVHFRDEDDQWAASFARRHVVSIRRRPARGRS